MTWSIRTRLTVWYGLVMVTVLVAAAVSVDLVQRRLAVNRLDAELERLMLTLEGVMRTEFGEGLDLQAAADEASMEVVAPDRALILLQPSGTPLAVWGYRLPDTWLPPTDEATLDTLEIGGARVRALSRPVTYRQHRYVAAVIAPLNELETEHAEFLTALMAGVAIALGVAMLGGWLIGRQTLRPLAEMAAQARTISVRDPSARLVARNSGDELWTFATAFNALLDRLAGALQSQRQFMADASHELRTPVSVVQTTAQVTLSRTARSAEEYREALTIVAEQSTRLTRLVNAMLMLSRAEAHGIQVQREPLYVDDVVADCARALQVVADKRRIEIRTTGDAAVEYSGDAALLRQMVSNLLDNALRHARDGGAVTAAVCRDGTTLAIRISDDGTGIAEGDRIRIFERFVRLGSRAGSAGLGLPIARWIAEAHGGTLVLESTGDAGSCFTVALPIG